MRLELTSTPDNRIKCLDCAWLKVGQYRSCYCTNHSLYKPETVAYWKSRGQLGLQTSWIDEPRRCVGFNRFASP